MPIPDFQNLMLPMLQLAADGEEHSLSDAIEALAAQLQLSKAERAEPLPSGGQARFDNKVGWARTHLGKALLLQSPRRGWFRITERGRELLAEPPARITVAYLMRYPEYLAFRSRGQPAEQEEAIAPEVDETPAPAEPAPVARLTVIDAAYQVLAAAGAPLHSTEIAQRMLAQGLWTSKGHTPGATVDSRIAVDIKANGDSSRFRRVGRSTFTVNNGFVPEAPPAATPTPQAGDRRPATLSFADAAEQVLKQFGKHQPMHYQAITRHIGVRRPSYDLIDLGVAQSHSRPTISDDNPYSEAQFKTMKYGPTYPERFADIAAARAGMRWFARRHLTHSDPALRHAPRPDPAVLERIQHGQQSWPCWTKHHQFLGRQP